MNLNGDTQALALALAGAKKPCECQENIGPPFGCGICKDSLGEVYVLGAECRVECMESCHAQGVTCKHTEQCRGWLPLDPHDMRWMVVLAEIGFVTLGPGLRSWQCTVIPSAPLAYGDARADTPWDALLMAAMKALGLEVEA